MDSVRSKRLPPKFHRPDWKSELRTNCLRRVKNDRSNLLWKFRAQQQPLPSNDMKNVESEVRNIISDELQKLKHSVEGKEDQEMDVTWEYQEPQVVWPADIDGEDVLLEMERLLYEDLREESIRKELEALDEEDAYLAQAVFEHMQLNDTEGMYNPEPVERFSKLKRQLRECVVQWTASGNAKVWCPVCKQGELRDTHNLIYCTSCALRLDLGEDKITLEFLRERLGNAHMEHFDRGCKAAPKFCLQKMFGMTALYIQCEECSTLDIVV